MDTTGSGTLTVDTDDDSVNEVVGRITATLAAGQGYTIATPPGDSASVTVTDNDTPVLSIATDTATVVEGAAATFTVTASPAPATALTVNVGVTQTGAVIAGTAPATLTVDTTGSGTLTVATDDDSVNELVGRITGHAGDGCRLHDCHSPWGQCECDGDGQRYACVEHSDRYGLGGRGYGSPPSR